MVSIAAAALPMQSVAARERSEARTALLLALPAIILIVLFVLPPIVAVVFLGFTDFQLGDKSFRFVALREFPRISSGTAHSRNRCGTRRSIPPSSRPSRSCSASGWRC